MGGELPTTGRWQMWRNVGAGGAAATGSDAQLVFLAVLDRRRGIAGSDTAGRR